jgi:hypothetical protein
MIPELSNGPREQIASPAPIHFTVPKQSLLGSQLLIDKTEQQIPRFRTNHSGDRVDPCVT